jgi:hypothetical protein
MSLNWKGYLPVISLRGASVLVAVLVLGTTPTMSIDTQVVSRHFTPREQQTERFHYVPFDVSAGTTRSLSRIVTIAPREPT